MRAKVNEADDDFYSASRWYRAAMSATGGKYYM